MRQAKRAVGAFAAAAALAATAGACGVFGGEDDDDGGDEARLVELLNENNRLDAELSEAEFRIIQDCLEEQGFTVHDQWELEPWAMDEQEDLSVYYPSETFVPEPEIAEKWGFGSWSNTDEGWESQDVEAYQEAAWGAEDESEIPEVDNTEFDALSFEERYDWYVAYTGEEYAQMYHADEDFEEGDLDEGVDADAEADGELEIDDEAAWDEPAPGGCKLEMIEALYGEPVKVEETEGEEGFSYWSWRPESPEESSDWDEVNLNYRDKLQDEESAFLDCIADRGHVDWTFDEWGELPVWDYFNEVYYDEDSDDSMVAGPVGGGAVDVEVPDVPEDLPDDFEGKMAYEIELALDFVECGDETGYKEASVKAWDEVQLDYYLDMEEDMYAWQEEMTEAIGAAQEMIDA